MAWLGSFGRKVKGLFGLADGFEGAARDRRLKNWQPSRAHVNALISGAGPDLLARARHLVRNNGYANNAVEAWAGNAVGTGIKLTLEAGSKTNKVKFRKLWNEWVEECDWEGQVDLYGLQRRAAREFFIGGECFIRIHYAERASGMRVPLKLQLLPSEMLPLWRNDFSTTDPPAAGNVIRQGIECDDTGRRVAYHFYKRHPGDITDRSVVAGQTVRVPAEDVIHIYDPIDAGQMRGFSRFSPAVVKLFLLDVYDDAELDRKKVAAMHALFIKTPTPDHFDPNAEFSDQPDYAADRTLDIQPGSITILEPGEEIQTSSPADSGTTFEPFQYRTLLQISAALGVPYALLTNDMVRSNYSNTRTALVEFRRRVEAFQHTVMVQCFQRVLARWLDVAELSGALRLPSYETKRREFITAATWLPPRWEWVDPMKDAQAEVLQIQAGLKSRTQAIAERGYDAEDVDQQIAEERKREKELDITFTTSNPAPATPPPLGHNGGPPLDDAEDDPPDGAKEDKTK